MEIAHLPSVEKYELGIIGYLLSYTKDTDNVLEQLNENCFYHLIPRLAFKGIAEINKDNKSSDIASLSLWAMKNNVKELVPSTVAKLTDNCCNVGQVDEYCKILIEFHLRRQFIIDSVNTYHLGKDMTTDIFDLYEETQKKFEITKEKLVVNQEKSMETVISETINQIRSINGEIMGTSTQRPDLDKVLLGLRKGFVYVVAGRPGMGKSIMAKCLSIATMQSNERVAVFQLEMTSAQFITNVFAETAKVNAFNIQRNQIKEEEWGRIIESGNYLKDYIYVDDETYYLSQIERKIRKLKKEKNISGVIIDYLQLIQLPSSVMRDEKLGNRENIIAYITKTLKRVAKKYGIWIIELSQLSRDVESRSDKRPQLSDLRESGSIEQDAEVVLLLYRPEYYGFTSDGDGNDLTGKVEVIIAKNRFGPVGSVFLHFNKKHVSFDPITEKEQESLINQQPDLF